MSKRWLILITALCGVPTTATAQNNPLGATFVRSPIPLEEQRINIEELVEDEADPAPVRLTWTVTGLVQGNWDYELTYGAISETSTAPPRLRVLETDSTAEAQGDQPIGVQLGIEMNLRDIIADPNDLPAALGGRGRDDYDQSICINIYPDGNPDFNQTASECWTFEVDTFPPVPPTLTSLRPGENQIEVNWTPLTDNNLQFYQVVHCETSTGAERFQSDVSLRQALEQLCALTESSTPTVTSTASFDELCPFGVRESGTISDTLDRTSISEGVQVGRQIVVAIRSVDEFENTGDESAPLCAQPRLVDDFFELYDGDEEGGFCFVATAAYGSYAHPTVRVLRSFRDRVLNATPVGAALVWTYYRYSPPLARYVADHPILAAWVRIGLVIVAAAAVLLMVGPFFALGWVVVRVAGPLPRRIRRLRGVSHIVVLALVSTLAGVGSAHAAPRPESDLKNVGIGLEFKGGPYSGRIQDDQGFSQVFDDSSRPLFQLGIDLQVFRGFGTITVGGTFGFLQYTGQAPFNNDTEISSETNVFNLVPLTGQVGYRFDWLADNTWIPLVPYAKGGLAYYIWWATDGVGNLQRRTVDEGTPNAERQTARGGTFGYTGTAGLAFMLNKLDTKASQALFASTSIRGAYFFAEMTVSQVDDFGGDSLDLSDFNWSVGLYMEL